MSHSKKMLLIDGHSLIFRAFYALYNQLESMKNQHGLHTNALYGFHNMIVKILEEEAPDYALVAFDAGKTTFRHQKFEEYKGGRDKMPAELAEQMPYFKEMLKGLGISFYELPNYEADDIIGTMSRVAEADGIDVVVISGDKDLIQLATDQVRVDITRKGVSDLQKYTPKAVEEEYGLIPEQIPDLLGLAGDPSDNIPGVTGVGEKTALKYLHEYGTVEQLYDHIDDLGKSKRKENLINEEELARLGKELATILCEAPVELTVNDTQYEGKNIELLTQFYLDVNFKSHLEKLDDANYLADLEDSAPEIQYDYADSLENIDFEDGTIIYLETLEDNYHLADIVGVAIGLKDQVLVTDAQTLQNSKNFKAFIEDERLGKVFYDAKSGAILLYRLGMGLQNISFDMVLASYVLTGENSSGSVEMIMSRHDYDHVLPDEAVYGKGKKAKVPEEIEKMYEHIASKVIAIQTVKDQILDELEANDQMNLLYDIEIPLSKILAEMEIEGVKVDKSQLEALHEAYDQQLLDLESKIYEEAGEEFNINSTKQLGEILFEKLGYQPIRKTKTGYSTAVDVLEKILAREKEAPIIEYILEYRKFKKVQSTYINGLMSEISPHTGLVHTIFQQAVTRTGRLSSTNPNLQNIPVRDNEGREVRKAFVPKYENYLMFSADYSQIELRLLAHIAEDRHFIEAFQNSEDIHSTTAMKVFDVNTAEEVTPNLRRDAKAVNFGIVYGISDYGLAENLRISRKDAKEIIDTYFDRFSDVRDFIQEVIREAKNDGYVTTLFGRRRYLPDINSSNFNLRSFAERTAQNTPIQGSAADIIKLAMIEIDHQIKVNDLSAKMLLQVHDELIFEAPESEMETLEKIVVDVMENIVDLKVPLIAESGKGQNWYELG